MHPSRAIHGGRSHLLEGRRVVLGVAGSIAAVESPRIARELIRHGARVDVVMSAEATRIVTPEAMRFATGRPVVVQLTGDVEHVTHLGPGEGQADLMLIAPATANTISKIAQGIDDTPVTSYASMALGGGVPLLLAPAMHEHLAGNPAVTANLARLREWGVGVIAPASAEGEAKIASPEEIAAEVLHRLARGPLAGRRVLVIGGASREPIDAVRSITNESSGETAVQLAIQAFHRGATVTLWAGALQVPVPRFVPQVPWRTVDELLGLVRANGAAIGSTDLLLVPAALSDYTLTPARGKISSRATPELVLRLSRAPKVLPELRRRLPDGGLLVGFKLVADRTAAELSAEALDLLHENGLDVVVANDRAVMGSPRAAAFVHTARKARHWLEGPKAEFAGKLLDDLGRMLAEAGPHTRSPAGASSGPRHRAGRPGRAGGRRGRRPTRAVGRSS